MRTPLGPLSELGAGSLGQRGAAAAPSTSSGAGAVTLGGYRAPRLGQGLGGDEAAPGKAAGLGGGPGGRGTAAAGARAGSGGSGAAGRRAGFGSRIRLFVWAWLLLPRLPEAARGLRRSGGCGWRRPPERLGNPHPPARPLHSAFPQPLRLRLCQAGGQRGGRALPLALASLMSHRPRRKWRRLRLGAVLAAAACARQQPRLPGTVALGCGTRGGQDVGDLPPWRADAQPWFLAPAPALQFGACRGPISWDWGPERGERRGSSAGTPKKALCLRPSRVSCSVSPGANRPGPACPACNRSPPAPYLGSTDGMRAARGADPWGRAVGLAQAVPSPTP